MKHPASRVAGVWQAMLSALILAVMICSPAASAQKTQAQLSSEILTNFPTCGTGCISAANLRAVMQDVVDSFFNVLSAQSGHVFLASPSDGSSGNPTYRNITGSDLPNPSATTLGGVQSAGPTTSQWINSISTSGVPALSQPSFTDLSGSLASSQMPALTGDVTSSAGSTVTTIPAGSISNSKLATMGTITLKGNLTGGTASPSDVAPSAVLDTFGSAQGTVIFRGASGWTALPPGSNGQVFTTGGASANPSWVTVGGTGTVTSVTCGTGLTGGTITISGTCALSTPVTVSNGGIGVGTLTSHGVLTGNGTGAVTATAAPSAGQILVGQSAAAPAPETMSGDCTIVATGAITCTTLNGVTMAPLNSPGLTGTPTAPTATAGTNTTQIATTAFVLANPPTYPPGTLSGLTLSNDGTSPNTVIDIATGVAVNNDGSAFKNMTLASALTKSISSTYTAGTGNGCLDTGTAAASTWYHIFIIQNNAGSVTDVLCSTSATSPTMPSGYTARRRIGSILTNGSTQIIAFSQVGDEFLWVNPPIDVNATNPGTSAVTRTLSVPTGVIVNAKITIAFNYATGTPGNVLITSLDTADAAIQASSGSLTGTADITWGFASSAQWGFGLKYVRTNTSAQVRSKISISAAACVLGIITQGWLDSRGK